MHRLLILPVLVLATPAAAHDWYSELKVPGSAASCCNERDCEPVPDCSSPGDSRFGVVVEGKCIEVNPNRVLGMYSPDGNAHACWGHNAPNIFIRCAIFPGQGT